MAHDVFISYSNHDQTTADAVCSALEGAGIRCWIAPRNERPGEDWAKQIVRAIDGSRVFVLVFSGRCNDSVHVRNEFHRAINKGIPILPFRIEDREPDGALALYLAGVHWLDALTPPLQMHLIKLVDTVTSLLSEKRIKLPEDLPEPKSDEEGHSWIGDIGSSPAPPPPTRRSGRAVGLAVLLAAVIFVAWDFAIHESKIMISAWNKVFQPPQNHPTPKPANGPKEQPQPKKGPTQERLDGREQQPPRIITFQTSQFNPLLAPFLLEAIKKDNVDEVKRLLLEHADPNATDHVGTPALHWAVREGNKDLAGVLIRAGADVKAEDIQGRTALMASAYHEHPDVMGLLLAKGADPSARDKKGRTALMWASPTGNGDVVGPLLDKGSDSKAKDKKGWTAVHFSLFGKDVDPEKTVRVLKLLIEKGADLHAKDNAGRTALSIAMQKQFDSPITQFLWDQGAEEGNPSAPILKNYPNWDNDH